MSYAANRRALRALALVLLAGVLALSTGAATALAEQSTITRQDCDQGRIHDRSGHAIDAARCQKLIGKSITLASTGFEAWIVGAAGVACLAGAFLLRRPLRIVTRR